MKNALLLGSDSVFAWALQRIVQALGFSLEHVFTLEEARIRMRHHEYEMLLVDSLREDEWKALVKYQEGQKITIIFSDLMDCSGPYCEALRQTDGMYFLSKECSAPGLTTALGKLLQDSEVKSAFS